MISRKLVLKGLLAILISLVINARVEIWYYLKPLPSWWKILIAVATSIFITVAFIFSCGMEGIMFQFLGIQLP